MTSMINIIFIFLVLHASASQGPLKPTNGSTERTESPKDQTPTTPRQVPLRETIVLNQQAQERRNREVLRFSEQFLAPGMAETILHLSKDPHLKTPERVQLRASQPEKNPTPFSLNGSPTLDEPRDENVQPYQELPPFPTALTILQLANLPPPPAFSTEALQHLETFDASETRS